MVIVISKGSSIDSTNLKWFEWQLRTCLLKCNMYTVAQNFNKIQNVQLPVREDRSTYVQETTTSCFHGDRQILHHSAVTWWSLRGVSSWSSQNLKFIRFKHSECVCVCSCIRVSYGRPPWHQELSAKIYSLNASRLFFMQISATVEPQWASPSGVSPWLTASRPTFVSG